MVSILDVLAVPHLLPIAYVTPPIAETTRHRASVVYVSSHRATSIITTAHKAKE